eukprot:TRINITY_DN1833_c0_g1_i2.p1 TRINITY_DN1833_c0_g1~~TRINITY_DN1833_c0_g1_i2.p1  ORF type:complete len:472 (-),score=111.04 TRINITY_DN1833_c0_g1_i2:1278-2693(-)
MATFTDSTRIEELLDVVIDNLRLQDVPEWSYREKMMVLKQFYDNWIFTVKAFSRLNVDSLREMNLPVVLRDELERLIPLEPIRPLVLFTGNRNISSYAQPQIRNQQPVNEFPFISSYSNPAPVGNAVNRPTVTPRIPTISNAQTSAPQMSRPQQSVTKPTQQQQQQDDGLLEETRVKQKIKNQESRFALLLTDAQKDFVKKSFIQLMSLRDTEDQSKDGIALFAQKFYPNLFKVAPALERLFSGNNLDSLAKTIMNMLGWVVNNIDKTGEMVPVLAQMGGRHELYGVKRDDFKLFATAVATTFREILGPVIIHQQVYESWESILNNIAELMQKAAQIIKVGYRSELMYEKSTGAWAKTWASLALDTLYFFKDDTYTKLRAEYPLRGVTEIRFPKNLPVKNCFELASTDPPFVITLACDTVELFDDWLSEFEWRIQAIQRVFSSTEDESDHSGSEDSVSEIQDSGSRKRMGT